jgi:peptide deformylase
MILPIVAYGDPVLRKEAEEIDQHYEGLADFIQNMWETMDNAEGVGLAAPQVGRAIRLFVVDASAFADEDPSLADFKKVFINPEIIEEFGEEWLFNEGCLSIPGIREDVKRNAKLKINYLDENFKEHEEEFDGMAARIIQHEYDHIEGILFTDRISALRKRMVKKKMEDISKGEVKVGYKMKFPLLRRIK